MIGTHVKSRIVLSRAQTNSRAVDQFRRGQECPPSTRLSGMRLTGNYAGAPFSLPPEQLPIF